MTGRAWDLNLKPWPSRISEKWVTKHNKFPNLKNLIKCVCPPVDIHSAVVWMWDFILFQWGIHHDPGCREILQLEGKLFRVNQVIAAATSWEHVLFYQLYSAYTTFEVTATASVRASGASTENLGWENTKTNSSTLSEVKKYYSMAHGYLKAWPGSSQNHQDAQEGLRGQGPKDADIPNSIAVDKRGNKQFTHKTGGWADCAVSFHRMREKPGQFTDGEEEQGMSGSSSMIINILSLEPLQPPLFSRPCILDVSLKLPLWQTALPALAWPLCWAGTQPCVIPFCTLQLLSHCYTPAAWIPHFNCYFSDRRCD